MDRKFHHRHTYEDAFAEVQSNAAWARLGDAFAHEHSADDFSASVFHKTPSLQRGIVSKLEQGELDAAANVERAVFKEVLEQGGVVVDLTQHESKQPH